MHDRRLAVPPFDEAEATLKVRVAEDRLNSGNPAKVATTYTIDSQWRSRDEFVARRAAIETFLARKWF